MNESASVAGEQSISTPAEVVDLLLKKPESILGRSRDRALLSFWLFLSAVLSVMIYGLIAGRFSAGWQPAWAALKLSGGLAASAAVCLPSLYIFSCISGAQTGFKDVTFFLLAGVCLAAVLLVGFSPVVWLFTESTQSLAAIGALHIAVWIFCANALLRILVKGFSAFGGSGPYLRAWFFVFLLVSFQMATVLRPILGKPDTLLPVSKRFFITHWSWCLERGDCSTWSGDK